MHKEKQTTIAPRILWFMVNITAAIVISFFFFIAVAKLHNVFIGDDAPHATTQQRQQILAEFIHTPPPPVRKETAVHLRTVTTPGIRGSSSGAASTIPITPDLGVEAGPGGAEIAAAQSELTAEVFDEGETDEDAIALSQSAIPYPERARESGIQGTFEALYIVDHKGIVTSVTVIRSPGPAITAEARKTMATWRFKPARNKGIPVNQRRKLIIEFSLE